MFRRRSQPVVNVGSPSQDDVRLIIANYLGSEGDHNTRETVASVVSLLDEMKWWMASRSAQSQACPADSYTT